MFDFIFDLVCGDKYHIMVLYIEDNTLYGVPCEPYMSGDYPVVEKKVKLSECEIRLDDDCDFKAIKVLKHNNKLDIRPTEDSWDGYQ